MLTPRDLGWVAGFLEGEGHFRFQPNKARGGGALVVTADQKQRLPLDHLVRLLGGKIYQHKRGIFVWMAYGSPAASVMMTMYGMMSPRRREQIARSLADWKTHRPWKHLRFCKRGHEYTPENTMLWKDGYKRCRACDQMLRRRRGLRLIDMDLIRAHAVAVSVPVPGLGA